MKKRISPATICFIIAGIALVLAGILFWRSSSPPELPAPKFTSSPTLIVTPTPMPTPTPEPAIEDDGLPHDKLFITPERQAYQDADMALRIPKLEVDVPVLAGVDSATLLRGIGLYDYAQLPGEGNRNVSIAGHRNGLRNGKITDNMPFYYIDTLGEGDCLYLTDAEYIYQYVWDETYDVEPSDWGPIYSQGFSCVTLTSCTPIGISDHRIIVRGRLNEVLEYDEAYDYPSSISKEAVE